MINVRADLQEMGLAAAKQVAGDAIERVRVEDWIDSLDRPGYRFTYLFDPARVKSDPGLMRIKIVQALLNELAARGDEQVVTTTMYDREAWDRRIGD